MSGGGRAVESDPRLIDTNVVSYLMDERPEGEPIALVLGILGLRYVGQHPIAKGTGHAIAGIVLCSLTLLFNWGAIIVFAIGIIAAGTRK
jgi:hypothetical protein